MIKLPYNIRSFYNNKKEQLDFISKMQKPKRRNYEEIKKKIWTDEQERIERFKIEEPIRIANINIAHWFSGLRHIGRRRYKWEIEHDADRFKSIYYGD